MTLAWKGLPEWVLAEAGIRLEGDLVALPYRLPDGRLYADRVVAPSGRRWWRPGDGRPVIPFGLDLLAAPRFRRYRALAILEGESDSLAMRAVLGDEVDTLGVPGAGTWKPEWAAYCRGYATVYALGDGDEAGRRLTARVSADVPGMLTVPLPDGEDVRSIAQRDGRRALEDLLDGAYRDSVLMQAFIEAESLDDFPDAVQRVLDERACTVHAPEGIAA